MLAHDMVSIFGGRVAPSVKSTDFLSIGISSPETMLMWSHGEVVNGDSINYRTYNAERGGLFCARIFGPTRDYECQCGKYRRIKYKGIVCEKCGVEVTVSRVRRERLGHIDLVSPVAHTLFLRSTNSAIANVLGMTLKGVERILYFESHVVIDPGNTTLTKRQVLSEEAYNYALDQFGNSFKVGSGAEVIHHVLREMDLEAEIADINYQLSKTKAEIKRRSLLKRFKLITDFINSGSRPEWMILTRIPVLPPDLRPLVPLDGGRFVSSDLNELYRRVINRNNRLRRMISTSAPEIIIRNEKRMLQEAVDALFDNSKRDISAKNASGRALKSLSDALRGKQGRFRQNLLGKRVDYSGRSVIIVGPSLRLHQCGLPKTMALELFKPFIFSKLLMYGRVASIKAAKKMVDNGAPELWGILEEIVREHVVLLNRAPTLHRLSIQAFEPKLIESKAIQLHPLVCKAFNADFDGDQMAVHVPLSIEAQIEARVLMMSSNNILSPQSGKPIISPTKDIAVGLYYMTMEIEDREQKMIRTFDSYNDIQIALDNNIIKINSKIRYYYTYSDTLDPKLSGKLFTAETTPGRVLIFELLPKDGKLLFQDLNTPISSKIVANILNMVYRAYGQKTTVVFTDKITALGFKYSTTSGLSFGKDDMVIPETKWLHINSTMDKIKVAQEQYNDGYITARERYNQVTDFWSECTDIISADVMKELSKNHNNAEINSIYIMMNSGARASEALMRQLAGMRGLIAKPSGEIIENPIISNFKEGLSVLEYFNSAHGARKGAADTALKTSDAGYLTRRLVDVAQDCVIIEHDCGSKNGITYNMKQDEVVSEKLSDVIFGRVLACDIMDPLGDVILKSGDIISESNVHLLDDNSIVSARVRSIVTCETDGGVCSMCYGRDLSTGYLVNIGDAVGVVAAQSIGEPGAQLTMQTFHIGGATSKQVGKSSVNSMHSGVIKYSYIQTVRNKTGDTIVVSNSGFVVILDEKTNLEIAKYNVPYSAKLHVKDGQKITRDQKVADWDPYNTYIISEYSGKVKLDDFILGTSYREMLDESMLKSYKIITDWTAINKTINPKIAILDDNGKNILSMSGSGTAKYFLPINAITSLSTDDVVSVGDILARIPTEELQNVRDITGGLPRVEEIFEARIPKIPAIVADIDGTVELDDSYKSKSHLVIHGNGTSAEYMIPRGRYIRVQNGINVRKGDIIVNGTLDPHDILDVYGIEELTTYIVSEVQQVYKLQGVKIDSKHIEIIVKYMLQKVEITSSGDSHYIVGHQVNAAHVVATNKMLLSAGKSVAQFKRVLQGITRASIQTESFISAASFQETTRVLTDAAICGKKDLLSGMKENIIVGRLIPAGTGFVMSQIYKEAMIINQQKSIPIEIAK